MPDTTVQGITYQINARDEIVFVSDSWNKFAIDNGAAGLAENVLGRSLWDFIADPTTRQLYSELLARVRAARQVNFMFRCDAPDKRRFLEMSIIPGPGGTVEFRTRTLKEEAREPVPLPAANANPANLLPICDWCQRLRVRDIWAEIDDAIAWLRLFDSTELPMLSHGICDDCLDSMRKKLAP
ncbi:MAG: hypothetical protein FJ271_03320 [Planctomycetes bacterium]|nr:hypothetical protein [Planctomycetota bacterium]